MNRAGDRGASVVLTVDEKEYERLLGHLTGGEPLPRALPGATPGDVTLTYSDGTTEVLK